MPALRQAGGALVQGFAPREIKNITAAAGPENVGNWLAFCFPEDDVTYQINGAGETATLSAGAVRVLAQGVDTITFSGFTTAKCEVM